MKGFIEVTGYYGERYIISVSDIMIIKEEREERENSVDKYFTTLTFKRNTNLLRLESSYEEIKQKIKQATEPKLMIDEKGNLKEQK